eukprot:s36_g57.t1
MFDSANILEFAKNMLLPAAAAAGGGGGDGDEKPSLEAFRYPARVFPRFLGISQRVKSRHFGMVLTQAAQLRIRLASGSNQCTYGLEPRSH